MQRPGSVCVSPAELHSFSRQRRDSHLTGSRGGHILLSNDWAQDS